MGVIIGVINALGFRGLRIYTVQGIGFAAYKLQE